MQHIKNQTRKAFTLFTACALSVALPGLGSAQSGGTTEGGSTQTKAQSGCMNQWMFNGMWRMRVTDVAFRPPGDHASAWNVTMQWANGTSISPLSPSDTQKKDLVLALGNGDTISAADATTGGLNEQQLDFHSFPASGQFTYTQSFVAQTLDPNNKPAKLLVTFDVEPYLKSHPGNDRKYWRLKTPAYNYRIDLTCNKAA